MRNRFGGRGSAPVNVGDELDVKVEAVGEKGDGIAKKDGFVLFVPNTKAGDEVKIKVTKVLRNVGFAEVVGQASGPVESAEAPAEEPAAEEEPAPEDTEDFGEEPAAEEQAEEPQEEAAEEPAPTEEAPAEEPAEETKE